MEGKVFVIGFQKTGTTSYGRALEHLGYRVKGPFLATNENVSAIALDRAKKVAPEYDAFQDNPWPLVYKEMDELYPGSKFILSTRPVDEWVESCRRHFGGTSTPVREWIYGEGRGDPQGNEYRWVERYTQHNLEAQYYFSDRPNDLLVVSIKATNKWERLCQFLGHPVPDIPFPHANKEATKPSYARKVAHRVKKKVMSAIGSEV